MRSVVLFLIILFVPCYNLETEKQPPFVPTTAGEKPADSSLRDEVKKQAEIIKAQKKIIDGSPEDVPKKLLSPDAESFFQDVRSMFLPLRSSPPAYSLSLSEKLKHVLQNPLLLLPGKTEVVFAQMLGDVANAVSRLPGVLSSKTESLIKTKQARSFYIGGALHREKMFQCFETETLDVSEELDVSGYLLGYLFFIGTKSRNFSYPPQFMPHVYRKILEVIAKHRVNISELTEKPVDVEGGLEKERGKYISQFFSAFMSSAKPYAFYQLRKETRFRRNISTKVKKFKKEVAAEIPKRIDKDFEDQKLSKEQEINRLKELFKEIFIEQIEQKFSLEWNIVSKKKSEKRKAFIEGFITCSYEDDIEICIGQGDFEEVLEKISTNTDVIKNLNALLKVKLLAASKIPAMRKAFCENFLKLPYGYDAFKDTYIRTPFNEIVDSKKTDKKEVSERLVSFSEVIWGTDQFQGKNLEEDIEDLIKFELEAIVKKVNNISADHLPHAEEDDFASFTIPLKSDLTKLPEPGSDLEQYKREKLKMMDDLVEQVIFGGLMFSPAFLSNASEYVKTTLYPAHIGINYQKIMEFPTSYDGLMYETIYPGSGEDKKPRPWNYYLLISDELTDEHYMISTRKLNVLDSFLNKFESFILKTTTEKKLEKKNKDMLSYLGIIYPSDGEANSAQTEQSIFIQLVFILRALSHESHDSKLLITAYDLFKRYLFFYNALLGKDLPKDSTPARVEAHKQFKTLYKKLLKRLATVHQNMLAIMTEKDKLILPKDRLLDSLFQEHNLESDKKNKKFLELIIDQKQVYSYTTTKEASAEEIEPKQLCYIEVLNPENNQSLQQHCTDRLIKALMLRNIEPKQAASPQSPTVAEEFWPKETWEVTLVHDFKDNPNNFRLNLPSKKIEFYRQAFVNNIVNVYTKHALNIDGEFNYKKAIREFEKVFYINFYKILSINIKKHKTRFEFLNILNKILDELYYNIIIKHHQTFAIKTDRKVIDFMKYPFEDFARSFLSALTDYRPEGQPVFYEDPDVKPKWNILLVSPDDSFQNKIRRSLGNDMDLVVVDECDVKKTNTTIKNTKNIFHFFVIDYVHCSKKRDFIHYAQRLRPFVLEIRDRNNIGNKDPYRHLMISKDDIPSLNKRLNTAIEVASWLGDDRELLKQLLLHMEELFYVYQTGNSNHLMEGDKRGSGELKEALQYAQEHLDIRVKGYDESKEGVPFKLWRPYLHGYDRYLTHYKDIKRKSNQKLREIGRGTENSCEKYSELDLQADAWYKMQIKFSSQESTTTRLDLWSQLPDSVTSYVYRRLHNAGSDLSKRGKYFHYLSPFRDEKINRYCANSRFFPAVKHLKTSCDTVGLEPRYEQNFEYYDYFINSSLDSRENIKSRWYGENLMYWWNSCRHKVPALTPTDKNLRIRGNIRSLELLQQFVDSESSLLQKGLAYADKSLEGGRLGRDAFKDDTQVFIPTSELCNVMEKPDSPGMLYLENPDECPNFVRAKLFHMGRINPEFNYWRATLPSYLPMIAIALVPLGLASWTTRLFMEARSLLTIRGMLLQGFFFTPYYKGTMYGIQQSEVLHQMLLNGAPTDLGLDHAVLDSLINMAVFGSYGVSLKVLNRLFALSYRIEPLLGKGVVKKSLHKLISKLNTNSARKVFQNKHAFYGRNLLNEVLGSVAPAALETSTTAYTELWKNVQEENGIKFEDFWEVFSPKFLKKFAKALRDPNRPEWFFLEHKWDLFLQELGGDIIMFASIEAFSPSGLSPWKGKGIPDALDLKRKEINRVYTNLHKDGKRRQWMRRLELELNSFPVMPYKLLSRQASRGRRRHLLDIKEMEKDILRHRDSTDPARQMFADIFFMERGLMSAGRREMIPLSEYKLDDLKRLSEKVQVKYSMYMIGYMKWKWTDLVAISKGNLAGETADSIHFKDSLERAEAAMWLMRAHGDRVAQIAQNNNTGARDVFQDIFVTSELLKLQFGDGTL